MPVIVVCWIPQSSAQRATYVPGEALNHVSLTRPGIASILPPSRGTHQLWLTSPAGAVTSRCTTESAGATIWFTVVALLG